MLDLLNLLPLRQRNREGRGTWSLCQARKWWQGPVVSSLGAPALAEHSQVDNSRIPHELRGPHGLLSFQPLTGHLTHASPPAGAP